MGTRHLYWILTGPAFAVIMKIFSIVFGSPVEKYKTLCESKDIKIFSPHFCQLLYCIYESSSLIVGYRHCDEERSSKASMGGGVGDVSAAPRFAC
jgi:hypothetical protein